MGYKQVVKGGRFKNNVVCELFNLIQASHRNVYMLGVGQGECQEAALTRRTSWRHSGGGVGLGLSGKHLHPATPELTVS